MTTTTTDDEYIPGVGDLTFEGEAGGFQLDYNFNYVSMKVTMVLTTMASGTVSDAAGALVCDYGIWQEMDNGLAARHLGNGKPAVQQANISTKPTPVTQQHRSSLGTSFEGSGGGKSSSPTTTSSVSVVPATGRRPRK